MFASFWHDVINRGRVPLLCCLVAFIVTRTIVRYIRHLSATDAPRRWWPHPPQIRAAA